MIDILFKKVRSYKQKKKKRFFEIEFIMREKTSFIFNVFEIIIDIYRFLNKINSFKNSLPDEVKEDYFIKEFDKFFSQFSSEEELKHALIKKPNMLIDFLEELEKEFKDSEIYTIKTITIIDNSVYFVLLSEEELNKLKDPNSLFLEKRSYVVFDNNYFVLFDDEELVEVIDIKEEKKIFSGKLFLKKGLNFKIEKIVGGYIVKFFSQYLRDYLAQYEKEIEEIKVENIKYENEIINILEEKDIFWINGFYFLNIEKYRNIFVVTDLHGSVLGLDKILNILFYEFSFDPKRDLIIFNGDYIDRGENSFLLVLNLFGLKKYFGRNIILLMGNHENFLCNEEKVSPLFSPSSFYNMMENLRNQGYIDESVIRKMFCDVFKTFGYGVFAFFDDKKVFISHSGFPPPEKEIKERFRSDGKYKTYKEVANESGMKANRFSFSNIFEFINKFKDNSEYLSSFLSTRVVDSPYKSKGIMKTKEIGKYCVENFMDVLNIDILIRGHEHPESGFEEIKVDSGKIITFFSGGGNVDSKIFINHGASIVVFNKNDIKKVFYKEVL